MNLLEAAACTLEHFCLSHVLFLPRVKALASVRLRHFMHALKVRTFSRNTQAIKGPIKERRIETLKAQI